MSLRFSILQANPLVGGVGHNLRLLLEAHARAAGADLLIASELFLSGYPPEDIVRHKSLQAGVARALETLAAATKQEGAPAILCGAPVVEDGKLYNSAVLSEGGELQFRHKCVLPNHNVFDEKRLFVAGEGARPLIFRGTSLGICICEDIWTAEVAAQLKSQGAEVLLVLNGSPFERDKYAERLRHARARVKETALPLVYVNQIGGQDELVFDGASFACAKDGALVMQMPAWEEAQAMLAWENKTKMQSEPLATIPEDNEAIYQALQLGVRDYAAKNGFGRALLGLSGGIDSALAAVIAADALGSDAVEAVMMPSPWTSEASLADARGCAEGLGIRLQTTPIGDAMELLHRSLAPLLGGEPQGLVAENIQSRVRGLILMAWSNRTGALLLSTGNKSELAVGYATLYGDMNGGFNPLKDVYKMQVRALTKWRNANVPTGSRNPVRAPVPASIITKPPSAELRPNQKDEDSLPPYEVLDKILHALIEEEQSVAQLIAAGEDAALVRDIAQKLTRAEYKRRQAPPGVKLHAREFGRGRRYPITSGFIYGAGDTAGGTAGGTKS